MKNISKIIAAATFAAAAIPAAFANSGSTWVGGEAGFEAHPVQSGLTRAQVRQELAAQGGAPGTADFERQSAQPEHQHRYVQVGRDRTTVHLDRADERQAAAPSTRGMGNAPSTWAQPSAQDLIGGPN